MIDAEAKAKLDAYLASVRAGSNSGRILYAGEAPSEGTFVAPHIIELADPRALREEIFGPILHVARYRADRLDDVLAAIDATGYGLTLGIHSRITETADRIARRLSAGNVYVNRNMIGAVGRRAAFRRQRPVRHRPESRRPALPAALRDRAGRDGEHGRRRRQCGVADGDGVARIWSGSALFAWIDKSLQPDAKLARARDHIQAKQ